MPRTVRGPGLGTMAFVCFPVAKSIEPSSLLISPEQNASWRPALLGLKLIYDTFMECTY